MAGLPVTSLSYTGRMTEGWGHGGGGGEGPRLRKDRERAGSSDYSCLCRARLATVQHKVRADRLVRNVVDRVAAILTRFHDLRHLSVEMKALSR